MLDGLLGRGFASKCKSLIKLTKTRIDVIRRKRKATEKFLKKDIADLLADGRDSNAYQRVDGLLVELVLSSCYDFVEQSCDFVLKHFSIMQKQRECPEDCREAVSSLMFAAARFSDLPELRDLRQIFQGRYGNSLELFVNQEFVKNLASKPSTLEKKVQLMQGIVLEYSITWDYKAFEKRMSKPSTYVQEQPKNYGSFNVTVDKNKLSSGVGTIPRGEKPDVSFKERLELTDDGRGSCNGHEGTVLKREELDIWSRHELSGKGYKALNGRERTILKKDGHDISYQGRQEVANDKHEAWNLKGDATLKPVRSGTSSRGKRVEVILGGSRLLIGRENTSPATDCPGSLFHGKPEISPSFAGQQSKGNGKEPLAGNNHAGQHVITNSVNKFEEVTHNVKPHYNNTIPPPYVKPNLKAKTSKSGPNSGSSLAGFDSSVGLTDPSMRKSGNAGNSSERIQLGSDHSVHERQVVGTASVISHGQEKDHLYQDNLTGNSIPKLRSSRRRHAKSHPNYNDAGYFEDTELVTRKSRSKGRDNSRRGLQILFDDEHYQKDEEERILDKLLMQYSKKPAPYELGKVRKSKTCRAHNMSLDVGESPHNSTDLVDEKPETVPPPPRSVSLPPEQTGQSKATKVFSHAASFQPDRSNPARHVHPKLPDYDDLAVKFAVLRGR